MQEKKKEIKKCLKIISLIVLIVFLFTPIGTFFHELSHWVFNKISPYTDPVGFHVLDSSSFKKNCLGYVVSEWSYDYAWLDEPSYFPVLSEGIAVFVNFLIIFILSFIVIWCIIIKRDVFNIFKNNEKENVNI